MGKINRRQFVQTTTAAAAAAAAVPTTLFGQAPTMMTPRSVKPVVVSSSNGHKFKNGGTKTCVETAFAMITGGADVLDALIAGVNIVELDPLDDSVGYGGLPNADGVVQLDSCCMHGPKKRAGGVGGDRGRAHAVEGRADGDGAHRPPSARRQGRAGLRAEHGLQDRGRSEHRELARQVARVEAPDRSAALPLAEGPRRSRTTASRCEMIAERLVDRDHYYGTINCDGVNAKGEVCGVTTTSGLAWKIPGRAGDSPILGAGPVRRRRRRRGRIDRARRGEPLQPLLVPDRRRDAPRRASEGRGHRRR